MLVCFSNPSQKPSRSTRKEGRSQCLRSTSFYSNKLYNVSSWDQLKFILECFLRVLDLCQVYEDKTMYTVCPQIKITENLISMLLWKIKYNSRNQIAIIRPIFSVIVKNSQDASVRIITEAFFKIPSFLFYDSVKS